MKWIMACILFMLPCNAMEFSRLESLPTDLKLPIIRHIISSASSKKQAIEGIRKWLAYDKALRNIDFHHTKQTWLEDHLGWHWNDERPERPISLAPKKCESDFFKTLKGSARKCMLDPRLVLARTCFERFYDLVSRKAPIEGELCEELLFQMDLHHRYRFCYVATIMPVDTYEEGSWTPLYTAVKFNREDIIPPLLQHGCDTEQLSNEDLTPLQYASKTGHELMVQIFINHKAPLDKQNGNGDTALHLTTDISIFNMLIKAGADPNIANKDGWKFKVCATSSSGLCPHFARVNIADELKS